MKLHKEFFHYVIPSMLAFALSGVYAIADGFFVGNALGDSALAAVNIAYPLTAFFTGRRHRNRHGRRNPVRHQRRHGKS